MPPNRALGADPPATTAVITPRTPVDDAAIRREGKDPDAFRVVLVSADTIETRVAGETVEIVATFRLPVSFFRGFPTRAPLARSTGNPLFDVGAEVFGELLTGAGIARWIKARMAGRPILRFMIRGDAISTEARTLDRDAARHATRPGARPTAGYTRSGGSGQGTAAWDGATSPRGAQGPDPRGPDSRGPVIDAEWQPAEKDPP